MNEPFQSRDGRLAAAAGEPAEHASSAGRAVDEPTENSGSAGPATDEPTENASSTGGPAIYERASTAPAAADGAEASADGGIDRPVDARTIAVWRWAALIAAVPIAATAALFTISMAVAGNPASGLIFILYLLLLVALGLNVWWYPAARYRRLRYRLDPLGVTITDGIWWRTQSSVARVRIQHTDISQGPLQRRYGVATLKLYTAGSRFTRIELPGLAYGDAVQLRDRLLEAGEGDAV